MVKPLMRFHHQTPDLGASPGILNSPGSRGAPVRLPAIRPGWGRRWRRGAAAVVIVAASGCRSPSDRKSPAEARATPRHVDVVVADDTDEASKPVMQMSVNGEVIQASEVLAPVMGELSQKRQTLSLPDYQHYVAEVAVQLLRDKVAEALLYQQASSRLTEAEEELIDKIVEEELRKRVSEEAGGIQWQYERELSQSGTTLDRRRADLRRQIIIQRHLHLNVFPKIQSPSRRELVRLFEEMKETVRRPERRKMSLIEINLLTRLEKVGAAPSRQEQAAVREQALREMRTLRREILDGADFAERAKQRSDGIQAASGGDWGWVSRDGLREKWKPAVEALYRIPAPGGLSDLVETPTSLFLVRCDEIQKEIEPDFQAMQPDLIEEYRKRTFNRLVGDLVDELRQKARIEPPRLERFLVGVAQSAPRHPLMKETYP